MKRNTLALVISLALAGCAGLPGTPERAATDALEHHNAAGMKLAAAGRYDEAIAHFHAAILQRPQAAYLYNNLGYTLLRRGLPEQAAEALAQALRLDPAHPQARHNLDTARAEIAKRRAQAAPPPAPVAAPAPIAEPEPPADLRLLSVAPNVYELVASAVSAAQVAAQVAVPPSVPFTAPAVAVQPEAIAQASARAVTPPRIYRLEVSNGNGVEGMARKVATQLSQQLTTKGLGRTRATNDRPFNKQATEVHYRAGFAAQAEQVAALLPVTARVLQAKALPAGVDVRVVLGAVPAARMTLAQAEH
jgi:hypothetical protein